MPYNTEKRREYNKKYYQENREKIKEKNREYYIKHSQKIKDRMRKIGKRYYRNHRDKIAKYQKEYDANHKDEKRTRDQNRHNMMKEHRLCTVCSCPLEETDKTKCFYCSRNIQLTKITWGKINATNRV